MSTVRRHLSSGSGRARGRLSGVLAVALVGAALFSGCTPAAGAAELAATGPEADRAIAVAHAHARSELKLTPDETYAFRSARDTDWMLVDGFDERDRPWAVFLQLEAGRWQVRGGSIGPKPAPPGVPCDIRFPFSESGC